MLSLEECVSKCYTYYKICTNFKIGECSAKKKISLYFNNNKEAIAEYERSAKNSLLEIQIYNANNRAPRKKKKRTYASFISLVFFTEFVSTPCTVEAEEYINWAISNFEVEIVNDRRFVKFIAQQIAFYKSDDDFKGNAIIFANNINNWRGAIKDVWLLRYGKIIGEIKYSEYLTSVDVRTGRTAEEIQEIRNRTSDTLCKNYSLLSTDEILARQIKTSPLFWEKRGYDKTDSKRIADEYEIIRKNAAHAACTTEEYKNNHKKVSRRCIEFWEHHGHTYDESILLVSNEQRRGLEYYVSLYGEEVGLLRHNQRTLNWISTMNAKSDEEKYEILRKKMVPFGKASKASMIFFDRLLEELAASGFLSSFEYHIGVGEYDEFSIYDEVKKKIRLYDFCIPDLNIIVEFNGLCFHCADLTKSIPLNPFDLNEEVIYNNDAYKKTLAESVGYEVLYVIENKEKQYAEDLERIMDRIRMSYIRYSEISAR